MAILNFARRYATRYLHWYAAGALMLVITNWLAVTIPLYLADGIDALDRGQPSEVPRIAGLVVLMGAVLVGVRTGSRLLFFTPGRLVEAEVKRDLFARLLDHQPAFVRRFAPADVISRASSDVNNIRLLAGFGVLQLLNAATALTLTGVQMVRISPELALWVLAPVGVGLVVTQAAIGRMFILIRRMQVQLASLSDHILSTYQGVATVQGFVAQGAFLDRFDGLNSAHLKTSLERANLRTAIGPVLAAAGSVNVFLLLYIGGPMAVRGEISVGQLVAFTTLIAYLVNPLRSVSFLLAIVKEAQASIERATEILDPPADRPDLPAPLAVPSAPPRIDIRGLTFAYPPGVGETEAEGPSLTDVTLSIPAGATLGLLGPTGSGKSTLLKLLARLYNPPAGTVFVDGQDVRKLDLDRWRDAMVLVPQRAFLFSEALGSNVLLSSPDDGRLHAALTAAALDQDVEALPDKTETEVGEAGLMLSGGQRQRVALARALVREPMLLLLDDVLSAVDHGTERELLDTLRGRAGCTTVIVAHRLTALRHADLIAVIEGGRVTGGGTHAELVEQPGFYRETWLRQSESGDGGAP